MCKNVKWTDTLNNDEFVEAIATLSRITSVSHQYEIYASRRNGGPVRYIVEIGGKPLLAWFDEIDSVVVVTPLELLDASMWTNEAGENEPILLLTISQFQLNSSQ